MCLPHPGIQLAFYLLSPAETYSDGDCDPGRPVVHEQHGIVLVAELLRGIC